MSPCLFARSNRRPFTDFLDAFRDIVRSSSRSNVDHDVRACRAFGQPVRRAVVHVAFIDARPVQDLPAVVLRVGQIVLVRIPLSSNRCSQLYVAFEHEPRGRRFLILFIEPPSFASDGMRRRRDVGRRPGLRPSNWRTVVHDLGACPYRCLFRNTPRRPAVHRSPLKSASDGWNLFRFDTVPRTIRLRRSGFVFSVTFVAIVFQAPSSLSTSAAISLFKTLGLTDLCNAFPRLRISFRGIASITFSHDTPGLFAERRVWCHRIAGSGCGVLISS